MRGIHVHRKDLKRVRDLAHHGRKKQSRASVECPKFHNERWLEGIKYFLIIPHVGHGLVCGKPHPCRRLPHRGVVIPAMVCISSIAGAPAELCQMVGKFVTEIPLSHRLEYISASFKTSKRGHAALSTP